MGVTLLWILLIDELLQLFSVAASGRLKTGFVLKGRGANRDTVLRHDFGVACISPRAHVDGHNNLALGMLAGCADVLEQAHQSIIQIIKSVP